MGDSIGFLTLVPVLALFVTPLVDASTEQHHRYGDHAIGRIEQIVLISLLVAISMLGYHWLALGNGAPIYYFLFLPLVWIAGRGGLRFAVIGVTCADLSVVALDAWYRLPASQLLTYQSYIAASSLTALTLGVMVTQRWREEHTLKSELERLVIDRTAQLERANRDLESFAYSVSHDLRAPLRAIAGFGLALEEDAGNKLDDRSRGHLKRIHNATERMTDLIAALLTFSAMARKEIRFVPIDISALARAIASDLRSTDARRKVSFAIADGLTAKGEPVLIRAVLENLINNAWKFTRNVDVATIAVGELSESGEFFVKDNGAGFDMTYAKRLFGAFQRLHLQEEFEGTGIGLATVARIVHRHGGAVRAEGEPGKGATIYFTLPEAGR
jgi:signal transduction histidine kinase